LTSKVRLLERQASNVAAWARQTGDQPSADRISCNCKYDRNDRCGPLCRKDGCSCRCNNDIDFEPDELSSDLGEALESAFRPAILSDDGPPFDPTQLVQTLRESGGPLDLSRSRGRAREPNGGQPGRLLRARCQRPRRRRAAEHRDEFAPPHGLPRTPGDL